MTTGGGNELPQADRIGVGIGEGVVGAFDHRQQRQLHRHIALFQALDDVMDIGAAAFAGFFDKSRVADEPQALLLDARVDADLILHLVAITDTLPDILGFCRGDAVGQPDRFALQAHRQIGVVTAVLGVFARALAAGQGYTKHHHQRLCALCQCL
ncbi:hypothetical protein D3C84_409660 [compost metagenome]